MNRLVRFFSFFGLIILNISCGLDSFKVQLPLNKENQAFESSNCQVKLSKKTFYLSETISINIQTSKVQSLSYNIIGSNDWRMYPSRLSGNDFITISAAEFGVGNFQLRIRANTDQQSIIDCQNIESFQIYPDINSAQTPSNTSSNNNNLVSNPIDSINQGDYISVYQNSMNIMKPDYSFYPENYIGFKNQFNPSGVTGCKMMIYTLSNLCAFSNTNDPNSSKLILQRQLKSSQYSNSSNQWVYSEEKFKIYLPKGSVRASGLIFLPQKTRVALVAKMDQPPLRSSPLSMDEYSFNYDPTASVFVQGSFVQSNSYQLKEVNTGVGFEKLLRGEEVIYIHDGGGSMHLFPEQRADNLTASALPEGRWLYIRIINKENDLVNVVYSNEVNSIEYRNWFNNAQFSSGGDPL